MNNKINLGIWSAYKAMSGEEQESLKKFLNIDDISFDNIMALPYNKALRALGKVHVIKDERIDPVAREDAYKEELIEKQKLIDIVDSEYERLGYDPEYKHHGLFQ